MHSTSGPGSGRGRSSPTPVRRYGRSLLRCAAVLVLALMAVPWLPAPPAAAHSALVSSDPAIGQVLRQMPDDLELVFSDTVRRTMAAVAVTIDEQTPVEVPVVVDGDTVHADLSGSGLEGPAGGQVQSWAVGYRVVAEDGHTVAGLVEFTVDRSLLASEPAEGSTVPTVPSVVRLQFGEEIAEITGVSASLGDLPEQRLTGEIEGATVLLPTAGLQVPSGAHTWRLGYRVVDRTGTVRTGGVTFDVQAGADPAAPASAVPDPRSSSTSVPAPAAASDAVPTPAPSSDAVLPTTSSVDPAARTDPESSAGESVSAWWWVASAAAGAGVVALVLRRRSAGCRSVD